MPAIFSVAAQRNPGSSFNLRSGGVFVLTNQCANSVAAFHRNQKDGTPTPIDAEGGLPFGMQGVAAK